MATILLFCAVLCETALFAFIVLSALRERAALARFVRAAVDPDRLKDIAMQLPGAFRAPATQFAGELARKGSLDDLVTQAVANAANTTFGLGLAERVGVGITLSFVVFAPLASAMFGAAASIGEAGEAARALSGPMLFLEAKGQIDPSFGVLDAAVRSTAFLLAGGVVIGAAHWWLLRSEVREARFVLAVLRAAIAARPGATAPVSGRLTQLLAPERSLGPPIAAFAFFFAALAAGWLSLFATSSIRQANAADVYDVWPSDVRAPFKTPLGMSIPPSSGGGEPINATLATLAIGPERIEVAGELLGDLAPAFAPPGRLEVAPAVERALSSFKRGSTELEVNLLVHADVPMSTVITVLQFMRNTHNLRRAHAVFARGVAEDEEGRRLLAGVVIQLVPPVTIDPNKRPVTVQLSGSTVTIDPAGPDATRLERSGTKWRTQLASVVQKKALASRGDNPQVWVAARLAEEDLTYGSFVEVLGAADSTCGRDSDCGVPGLGIRYYLDR